MKLFLLLLLAVGMCGCGKEVKEVWVKVPFGDNVHVLNEDGSCPKDANYVLVANVVNGGPGCVEYHMVWMKVNIRTGEQAIDYSHKDAQ